MTQANDRSFMLNESGARLAVDALFLAGELGPEGRPKLIDYAINQRGFVLITPAHHAAVVELCPLRVAPLAALAAIHHLKRTAAECILLASLGDTWRRSQYELFASVGAAVERLRGSPRSGQKGRRRSIGPRPRCYRRFEPVATGLRRDRDGRSQFANSRPSASVSDDCPRREPLNRSNALLLLNGLTRCLSQRRLPKSKWERKIISALTLHLM